MENNLKQSTKKASTMKKKPQSNRKAPVSTEDLEDLEDLPSSTNIAETSNNKEPKDADVFAEIRRKRSRARDPISMRVIAILEAISVVLVSF